MAILCGHCKQSHNTRDDVLACSRAPKKQLPGAATGALDAMRDHVLAPIRARGADAGLTARLLRASQTRAEKLLSAELAKVGRRWHAQYVIEGYVVDFFFP